MRVALHYPWVYLKGGAERTLLNLMKESHHHWTLFTNHYDAESTFPEFADMDIVQLSRISVRRSLLHAGHAAGTILTQQLPLNGHRGVMTAVESIGNLGTVRTNGVPLMCLCLTPLRVAYDPIIRSHFEAKANPITRMAVRGFSMLDRQLWKRYQQVFAISQEVKGRLINARLVDPARIQIARPGVDLQSYPCKKTFEPFFLLPGRIMWTKNVELGIDAFKRLKATLPEAAPFKLVIAGMVDRKSRPYLEALQAHALSLGSDVVFQESPSDDELRDYYARCYATLFCAYNEDWGLVPLESMASGKPVIAVDRGGPKESIIDGVTGFLRPPDARCFADCMAELIRRPSWNEALGRKGRERAEEFSWCSFVQVIDNYVDTLA